MSKPIADARVMAIVQRNADDERRHLQYIEECLRMRPWETTGAHA